jgi:hypothetical protein
MEPVATIRRIGFRKWYERQLVESHASLVTLLLCGLTFAILLDEVVVSTRAGGIPVTALAIVAGAGVIGTFAWRHYITVLERAERYGERSTCVGCKTYGRFDVTETGVDSIPGPTAKAVAPLQVAWMRVTCRKCGLTWRMPE